MADLTIDHFEVNSTFRIVSGEHTGRLAKKIAAPPGANNVLIQGPEGKETPALIDKTVLLEVTI